MGLTDVGGAAVIRDDLFVLFTVVVVKWDLQLVSQGIDHRGADAKASERARARHEFDFGDVVPGFAVFC